MTNEEIKKYEVKIENLQPFTFESLEEVFEFIKNLNPTEVRIKRIKL